MTNISRRDISPARTRAHLRTRGRAPALVVRCASWLFKHRTSLVEIGAAAAVVTLSAWSAVLVKEAAHAPTLLVIEDRGVATKVSHSWGQSSLRHGEILATLPPRTVADAMSTSVLQEDTDDAPVFAEPIVIERALVNAALADDSLRWFNGRPIKPAEVVVMRVTAYSPDHRSCGEFADGLTATLHHVTTNGGHLVAADPRVLPMGSIISVPGYDEGRVVPVLDKGGAIKGQRLDVLFPTHREALRWGVQDLRVTVWEYADGLPAGNPRHER